MCGVSYALLPQQVWGSVKIPTSATNKGTLLVIKELKLAGSKDAAGQFSQTVPMASFDSVRFPLTNKCMENVP